MGFLTGRSVFAVSAAVLLVSLGLGIIYLVAVERLTAVAAALAVAIVVAVVTLSVRVGRMLEDSERP